jgi:hypothetical protein
MTYVALPAACGASLQRDERLRESPMTKGKSGTFRGFQGKGGPPAGTPQGKRPAAPPAPRMNVRPKGSAKGR